MPTAVGTISLDDRVLDAAMVCVGRWGPAKTTLDDIAREARCSRATVYRLFPGGKDSLLRAVVVGEVSKFFDAVDRRLAEATSLEDLLTAGITEALTRLGTHPALRYVLEHEPAAVMPAPASPAMRQIVDVAAAFTAERLIGWVSEAKVRAAADWVVRLTLSYALSPDPSVGVDERWVRRLVQDLLLPALTTPSPVTEPRS